VLNEGDSRLDRARLLPGCQITHAVTLQRQVSHPSWKITQRYFLLTSSPLKLTLTGAASSRRMYDPEEAWTTLMGPYLPLEDLLHHFGLQEKAEMSLRRL
jgi:hypothetical protein